MTESKHDESCDWERGCSCGAPSSSPNHVWYHATNHLTEYENLITSVHEYIHVVAEKNHVSIEQATPIAIEEIRDLLRKAGMDVWFDGENFDVIWADDGEEHECENCGAADHDEEEDK